jgi:hypothetical protein
MRSSWRASRHGLVGSLAAVVLGVTLSSCGSSPSPPTTTSTTTTTSTIPTTTTSIPSSGRGEHAFYVRWCSVKIFQPKHRANAVLGPPFRRGNGPIAVFGQHIPAGFSYAIWINNNYALFAVYSGSTIFELAALPRTSPPVAFPCTRARGGHL